MDAYKIHSLTKFKQPLFAQDKDSSPLREWVEIFYKSYPRMPRIDLAPHIEDFKFDLRKALIERCSKYEFSPQSVSLKELASILYFSGGIVRNIKGDSPRRPHPSGGARYPLEIYPLVLKPADNLKTGLYHYNIKENSLEFIYDKSFSYDEARELFVGKSTRGNAPVASIVIFISAVFFRTEIKYTNRAYRLILLEAGHLAQNFSLVAHSFGLNFFPIIGFDNNKVDRLLDVDGINETAIYAFVMGH